MFCIYVNREQESRLTDASATGIWEFEPRDLQRWRSSALQDVAIFGCRGPNARMPPGSWGNATLHRIVAARVLVCESTESDRERLRSEVFGDEWNVRSRCVGEDVMESLRLSANNAGRPTPVAYWPALAHLAQLVQPARSRGLDPIQSLVSLIAAGR
ncbi:hypothetical protein [Amycolatopsis sp. NPDC004079]|uniref:hypothetical protein n=1 Tax=Amycolatopsis sp. NPDC004079 TaxID=3154549 RepID=UPI00339DE223